MHTHRATSRCDRPFISRQQGLLCRSSIWFCLCHCQGGLALPELGDTGMRAGRSDHRNDLGVRHTLLLAQ